MSSIQSESPTSQDGRTAGNGLLTREGQRLNHNSCEKLRRNLYRSILQDQLVPLIPQCNYGSCKSLGYVWEKCRERALEILEKRKELIAKLEAQGVDVEKDLGISKDVQRTRVEEPPKETSRQLAEKLPVPIAKLMSNSEDRPEPRRREEQPRATRQPAAKRRKRLSDDAWRQALLDKPTTPFLDPLAYRRLKANILEYARLMSVMRGASGPCDQQAYKTSKPAENAYIQKLAQDWVITRM